MAENKKIKLTDDPLENIHIMIPFLNDESRKAISYLIYGVFIGSQMVGKGDEKNTKKEML